MKLVVVLVLEAREGLVWSGEREPHDVARNVILGHMPGVKIARAMWADDVETVEELVYNEEDE